MVQFVAWGILLASLIATGPSNARTLNGFEVSDASIPVRQIKRGGPPRDGIPAINRPAFVSAGNASNLSPKDRVLGLVVGGHARAYPIRILNWHELVNDRFGEQTVLISYCPLCGTGMAFSSNVQGQALTFGVSGLLYNSDVLFYDRQTQSLWSQLARRAVTGSMNGAALTQLPLQHTTWQRWRTEHPNTEVLSFDLGFDRDYVDSPYEGYEKTRRLFFKVSGQRKTDYHPKERVLGIDIDGATKAYPFAELRAFNRAEFGDKLHDQAITILWDEESETASAVDEQGQLLVTTTAFWFAWVAFNPETAVFKASNRKRLRGQAAPASNSASN